MKTNNYLKELFIGIMVIAPLAYFFYLWNNLPVEIPIHFTAQGNPDNYGSRATMGITLTFLSLGTYLLLLVIPKIDPKKNFSIFSKTYQKLRFILSAFFCALCFIIILSVKDSQLNPSWLSVVFGLLFALMGNYLSNIRPNYFIGIRTPWALENETNWKKTHFLAGRLWFFSGLFLILMTFIIPVSFRPYVFLCIVIIISVIPIIYSYIIYKKDDNKDSNNLLKNASNHSNFSTDDSKWVGYLFYNNKYDKRMFVPKRIGFGYTINFGNPYSYLLFVAIIVLIILFSKIA